MITEACIETPLEARLAAELGINRVELCTALDLGGLTPGSALVASCARYLPVHVMVRPRPGSFFYSSEELKLMEAEIASAAITGAKGVVLGCLDEMNQLHPVNGHFAIIAQALGLEITFHRAFDFISNHQEALDQLIQWNFTRLLTSGKQATAEAGIETVRELVQQAKGRIQIMAGSGVNPANCKQLAQAGVDALHFSIRKPRASSLPWGMGTDYLPDPEKALQILNVLTA